MFLLPNLQCAISLASALIFLSGGCGRSYKKESKPAAPMGRIEAALQQNAVDNGIPFRFIAAVGMYESNLTSTASRVPYLASEQLQLGFSLTETAFGISRGRLGINEVENQEDLTAQISSYAKLVGDTVKDLRLPSTPVSPTDKYLWLWEFAKLHRIGGEYQRENENRVIWALGLIDVLNKGQVWQDPATGESLVLSPENPPISIQDFPLEAQKLFDLDLGKGEVKFTKQLELITSPTNSVNQPNHIEVIHCPMNLSACIEIQNLADSGDSARLRAHYIIPQDDSLVAQPIQVTPHDYAVELTGNDGAIKLIDDAFVVMLVGTSGRYDSNGFRINANPTWFTPWQLQELGKLSHRLCQVIVKNNEGVTQSRCLSSTAENGIRFHYQGADAESYRWGEIPDYDETIFQQYIRNTDTQAVAIFEFPHPDKRVPAATEFMFNIFFPVDARRVLVERAVRCPNQKLVWATIQSSAVQAKVMKSFQTEIHDAGPNGDGHHFLRAMVYNAADTLIGWAIDEVFVRNFEPDVGSGEPKACIRNGT
jgi:hypothetical protein